MNTISHMLQKSITPVIMAVIASVSLMSASTAMAGIDEQYQKSCATCHDSGALGAIKKGDHEKWQRLKTQKGMDALIKSVKNGMIQMPAGGLCDNCSDEDYRQLIEYMSR